MPGPNILDDGVSGAETVESCKNKISLSQNERVRG